MMIMTTWQGVITIIMAMLGTMLTRFLPFLLFPESKEPPRFITYLGTVLPYAMTGLLVVYSLKGVHLTSGSHGIPELLAIIAIALLHIWKRNMLLSIAGGTAVYMLLVQLVFSSDGFRLCLALRLPGEPHLVFERHHTNGGLLHLPRERRIAGRFGVQSVQHRLHVGRGADTCQIAAGFDQPHTQITRLHATQSRCGQGIGSDDALEADFPAQIAGDQR